MSSFADPACSWRQLAAHLRAAAPFAVLGGVLIAVVENWAHLGLGPSLGPFLSGLALALYAGGLLFLIVRAALRMAEAERGALRTSEIRFRNLTRLSADWFWETDAEHRVSWISGGAQIAMLFGERSVYGMRWWDLPDIEIQPDALAAHVESLDSRRPFSNLEISVRGAHGEACIHALSGEPMLSEQGVLVGYRGVARDVSLQRSAERDLAKAKERLDLAVAGGSLVVGDIDLRRGVIYLGEGWGPLLGQAGRGARTLTLDELVQVIHRDDMKGVRAAFVSALKGESDSFNVEYRVRQQSGGWRWVQSTGRVNERDSAGRATRASGIAVDADSRKRAEQDLKEMEQRYRSLAEVSPDGIVVHANGIVEYANPAAARLFKAASPGTLFGLRISGLFLEGDGPKFRERLAFLSSGPGIVPFEGRTLKALDGSLVHADVVAVSYLENGRLLIQSVLRDASELRRARDELADREQRFRDVAEASGEYVWETNAALEFIFLSARVEAVLGYAPGELLGLSLHSLTPLGEAKSAAAYLRGHAAACTAFREFQVRTLTKAGRVIWQSLSGLPVIDRAGRLRGYRGTGADITPRKQAEDRIQYLATRDTLTGLPNRTLLVDRLNQAILHAARNRGSFALLFLDIDRFKLVNGALGHAAGDTLLRAVAERLAHTLGRQDALARLGGDEFVVLWEGPKSFEDAATLAQRLLGILARPFQVGVRPLTVRASIGVSLYPEHGRDAHALLRCADTAMQCVKELGGGTFRIFGPELSERAGERLRMESDLRLAPGRGELHLHWQPVVRSRGAQGAHRLVGAEALLRWAHPLRGMIPPDIFIPLAEECGLVRALGEWTLERALSRIGAWQRLRGAAATYSVNVSAHELAQGDAYVERLREGLLAHGVEGSALEIEVTERVLLTQLPANLETLERIGALGIRIAIDDFGTGFSSLAYLRRLPVHKLKIDRCFVRELDQHPADEKIVRSITALAGSLGLAVAAEGVENRDQLSRLLALGCHEWQGHHFSESLEADAFDRLATESARAVRGGPPVPAATW